MLSFEPNIIVIDDKEEEVKGIVDYYIKQGLGCKFYNADYIEGHEMPEKPYSDVNLVFLDLFYNENFDAEQCSNWIQSLIYEKSFYILIVWSKDPAKTSSVIDELTKINRLPFLILEKNKSDYPSMDSQKFDFSKLFDEINKKLEKTSSLSEIGIWRKRIKSTTNAVVGHLTKKTNPDLFKSKLQKIIIAHGGTAISNDNVAHKRNTLFEALDQILISNTNNSSSVDEISQVNIKQLYSTNETIKTDIDRELNSWFHFKLQKKIPKDLIIPGLICEFKIDQWKNMYSIEDDKIIKELLGKQKGENTKVTSIALLLSRPCDIAQGKYGKNLKLLSGVKILNPQRKENVRREFKFNSSRPDSIKLYDHLHLSEEENDIALLFDFRYVFSVPSKIFIDEFKNLKVFNKELLSEMQVEYSSYSSRLGITQII